MKILSIFTLALVGASAAEEYFKITVIDDKTGRGVPLVELRTTNQLRYYTDSNGIVAFYEPGLMDQEVYFQVRSPGYVFPSDGSGRCKLRVASGGSAVLRIRRLNIAERLYRVTGEGIYRDSVLVGQVPPLRHPLLNGKVVGQDTVLATPYRGRIYWFWGDTHGPANLNLAVSGATSEWPSKGGLDPSVGVDLTYFVDPSGFSKSMCPVDVPGLKWLEGLMTVKDGTGRERLAARFAAVTDRDQAPNQWGLAVFNDEKEVFEQVASFGRLGPVRSAHPFRATVKGHDYYYLFPDLRVKADLTHLKDLSTYEAFTPLLAGTRYERKKAPELDRGSDGHLRYGWKAGTGGLPHLTEVGDLVTGGHLRPEEVWARPHDMLTGAPLKANIESVFWNPYRRRWVMLAEDLGKVWYAEGDTPLGPWVYAREIVTHDRYLFYNVTQHPFFDQQDGRIIYFEGTYTDAYGQAPEKSPRYEYNQIMYRLALDDPRLFLPAPVYHTRDGLYVQRDTVDTQRLWDAIDDIPFFALPPDRQIKGSIPISGFYALPVRSRQDLSGRWNCKFRDRRGPDAGEYSGELEIDGGKIAGRVVDLVLTQRSFDGVSLVLDAGTADEHYVITGKAAGTKLAGEWNRPGTTEEGYWDCERETPSPAESQALVPLYQYRTPSGKVIYSTSRRSASDTPIALVWRNPIPMLILDREAQPAIAERGTVSK